MFQITVTIGRNYGANRDGLTGPMSSSAWGRFRDDAQADVTSAIGEPAMFDLRNGIGCWNGIAEESALLIFLYDLKPSESELTEVRENLSTSREVYWQDAIAFSYGTSELI